MASFDPPRAAQKARIEERLKTPNKSTVVSTSLASQADSAEVEHFLGPSQYRANRLLYNISEFSWARHIYFGDSPIPTHTWYHALLQGDLSPRSGLSAESLAILNDAGKKIAAEVLAKAGKAPCAWRSQPSDDFLTLEHLDRRKNLPRGDPRNVSSMNLAFLESQLNSKWNGEMPEDEKRFFAPSISNMDLLLNTMHVVAEEDKPTSVMQLHALVLNRAPALKDLLVPQPILGWDVPERKALQDLFVKTNGGMKQTRLTQQVLTRDAKASASSSQAPKHPKISWSAQIERILGITLHKKAEELIEGLAHQQKLIHDVERLSEQQKEVVRDIVTRRGGKDYRVCTLIGGPAAGKTDVLVLCVILQICMHAPSTNRPVYIITQMRPTADEIVDRLNSYGLDASKSCFIYHRKRDSDIKEARKERRKPTPTRFVARFKVYTLPKFAHQTFYPTWLDCSDTSKVPIEKRHTIVDDKMNFDEDTPDAVHKRREFSKVRRNRELGQTEDDEGKPYPKISSTDTELDRAIDAILNSTALVPNLSPAALFAEIFPGRVRFDDCFGPPFDSIDDDLGPGRVLLKFWSRCRSFPEWRQDPDHEIRQMLYKKLTERVVARPEVRRAELRKVVDNPTLLAAFLSDPANKEMIRNVSDWFVEGDERAYRRNQPAASKLGCFVLRLREKALRAVSNGECTDVNRFPFVPKYSEYVTMERIEAETQDSQIKNVKPSDIIDAMEMYDNILLGEKKVDWSMLHFTAYTTMKTVEGAVAVWVDEAQTAQTLFLRSLLEIFRKEDPKRNRLLTLAGQPQQNTMGFAGGHGDFRELVRNCGMCPTDTMEAELNCNFASSVPIVELYNRTILKCKGGDPLIMHARPGAPSSRPVVFAMHRLDTTRVELSEEQLAELNQVEGILRTNAYRNAVRRQPLIKEIDDQRYDLIAYYIRSMVQHAEQIGQPLERTEDEHGQFVIEIDIFSRVNEPDLLGALNVRLASFLRQFSIVLDVNTCHQSLGTRAPHVIVIGFEPKHFPESEETEEAIAMQNLTMVADSRPRYTLYFIVHVMPAYDYHSKERMDLSPGTFLRALFPPNIPHLVEVFGVESPATYRDEDGRVRER